MFLQLNRTTLHRFHTLKWHPISRSFLNSAEFLAMFSVELSKLKRLRVTTFSAPTYMHWFLTMLKINFQIPILGCV